MNTKKVEKQILEAVKPLRLRGILKKRTETLEGFLQRFFTDWNSSRPTIYVGNGHTQTEPDKRRSLGDIFQICRYYYPNCTVEEVSKILYSLVDTVPNFRSSYCNQINKRVFYKGTESQDAEFYDEEEADEFGYTVDDWESIH